MKFEDYQKIIETIAVYPRDNELMAISYLTLAAINKFAGGGMKLAPNAINNDGLFDVVCGNWEGHHRLFLQNFGGKFVDAAPPEMAAPSEKFPTTTRLESVRIASCEPLIAPPDPD